jgi:hypothetical protein
VKILLGIPVCRTDAFNNCPIWLGDHADLSSRATPEERRNAVRETWWSQLTVDRRFFFGTNSGTPLDDEIFLDVPDSFDRHCQKNQAMFEWALENGYDFVFRSDDDTYVRADKLEQAAQSLNADQIGWCPWLGAGSNYITGGAGFWISRRAMEAVVATPVTRTHEDDLWIGRSVFAPHPELTRKHDPRYVPGDKHYADPSQLSNIDWITAHSCTPAVMRELHSKYNS